MAVPKAQQETLIRWAEQDATFEISTSSKRVKTRLTKLGYVFEAIEGAAGWTATGVELDALRFRKIIDGQVIRREAVGAAAERHRRRTATGSGSLRPLATPDAPNASAGSLAPAPSLDVVATNGGKATVETR